MDVALRVVESVTMMHNGRIFKEGRPEEIEIRSGSAGALSRGRPWLTPSARRRCSQVRGLNVYLRRIRTRCRASSSPSTSGVLSVVGRNGMGKTTLCKTIMGLVRASSGSIRFGRATS